ncbi:hypothetical protein KAJ27_06735 [bacterium]|nr:hypothetical protein [bacterium]
MLKTRFKKMTILLLLSLPFLLITGCINSAISDGVIKGKLYVFEGSNPALNPVKVRVEAIPNGADQRLNFRYTIIEPSAHGEYVINNVPPGEYTLQFDIQGKQNGYAYVIGLSNLGPTAPNAEGTIPAEDVPIAFIESGRTYEMPDYYIVKSPQNGSGSFKGTFVYSALQIPLENVTIEMKKAGSTTEYATTNADGEVIFPKLETGTWTIGFADSGEPIYDMVDAGQNTITVAENHVFEQTYILKYAQDNLPTIRGLVNIPKKFKLWMDPATDIIAFLSLQNADATFATITVDASGFFETNIQPWLSKYQLNLSIREPLTSNRLVYPIPALGPGQVYEVPDNALDLEIAFKTVDVHVHPPAGVPASLEIIVSVTVNGIENNFIAQPAGQFWQVSVDVPYSMATFTSSTVLKIGVAPNTADVNAIPIQVSVSENTADVVNVFYQALP